ncbi:MAG: molybdopterin-dependent oxidoreductase [Gordonibacter sp.]|uniref:molybdopterin-containing oxidoreductase family protein n=3 Tax=Gordonibacter sp. TaxID=1968902 RepID=UPI002FC7A609
MAKNTEGSSRNTISRRTFFKGGAAVAAGAALTGGTSLNIAHAEGTINNAAPVEKRYTYCDMCNQVPRCGMTAFVQDGKIVRVESRDPHPVSPLCAKGLASIQELYDPKRLQTPLRRTNPKGTGASTWEPISWDEAYQTIASEFNRVKEAYGADSVMFYCGDPKEPRPVTQRLAALFGSSTYGLESSLCSTATDITSELVYGRGQSIMGSDPTDDTASCLIWSINRAWSKPNHHAGFMDQKERGCKFVVVDPRITPTVSSLADIHLQLRPGSDGALALGFINILIRDNLIDKAFVDEWTHGFDELAKLAAQYPPEKIEEITWVPAAKLEEAVHLLAENSPSTLLSSSAGLAHSSNVGHALRAIFMIPALLGNVEKKGGFMFSSGGLPFDLGGSNSQFRAENIYTEQKFGERRVDREDFPVWNSFTKHFQTAKLPEYIDAGKIKAGLLVACNAMIWPESNRYQEALGKLEFSAAVDYYERPWTHDYVDLLLPAAMCHERMAPFASYGRKIYFRDPCVAPAGQAREDWQIVLELGCALGFEEECFGGNVEKAIESILETSKLGITVADLRANPEGLEIPGDKNPDNKHVLGKFRKDGQPGFNTPSGKIEFDSEILKSFGYDGPPIYEEPIHTPLNPSEEDKKYPLVLNSGSRLPYYTHSKLREIPWLNQFMPEPVVRLHPKDARERSINNGDSVRVFNHQNEIEMKAEVTNMVHAGMVDIFHGWHQANVNLLTTRDFDPITGFPPFRSGLCEVASTGKGRVVEQKKS